MATIDAEYKICNYALGLLGHEPITEAQFTTPPDTNTAARMCDLFYNQTRDELLSDFPWEFAMRQIEYDVDDYIATITGVTQADPVVVTYTAVSNFSFPEGEPVYIYDTNVGDIDDYEIFIAENVTSTTIELYKRDGLTSVDGSAYTAYSSGGSMRMIPISDYSYKFPLPSDCLTLWRLKSTDGPYKVERGHIYVDDDEEVKVSYIQQVTTVANFHSRFILALAYKLAEKLQPSLAKTTIKKADLRADFNFQITEAKRVQAIMDLDKDGGNKRVRVEESQWQKSGKN